MKLREFSSNGKSYKAGEMVPANVVIVTDFGTTDFQSWEVIPINI